MRRKPKRRRQRSGPERLRPAIILAWADAFFERRQRWPDRLAGSIPESLRSTWRQVDNALIYGFRGLRGGSTLAQFLTEHRGVRNRQALPHLSERQILAWADRFEKSTGRWPRERGDGAIPGTDGETWRNVGAALREGGRGLPGGSSLQQLLESRRGVRNQGNLGTLTTQQVLRWADEFHARRKRWPSATVRTVIPNSRGETWRSIDNAMKRSARGFTSPTSLAEFLADHRGYRHVRNAPPLTIKQILAWADAYRASQGRWPAVLSGPISGTQDTWARINDALRHGFRELPGGSSLLKLIKRRRRT